MKNVKQLRKLFFLMLLSVFVISCDKDNDDNKIENDNQLNIAETAIGEEALSSLVAALSKADEKEGTNLIPT